MRKNTKELDSTQKLNLKKSCSSKFLSAIEKDVEDAALKKFEHKPYQCDIKLNK